MEIAKANKKTQENIWNSFSVKQQLHQTNVNVMFVHLILFCTMLKNCHTYFKNLAVFPPQVLKILFGHFAILYDRAKVNIAILEKSVN